MPHKVEISDKTFERLKEYCELNGIKIGQCADKLIFDGLMIEMYGDVPFTDYKEQLPWEEIVKLVKEAEMNSIPITETTGDTSPAAQVVKDVFKQIKSIGQFRQEYFQDPGPMTDELRKKYDEFDEVERMNRRDREIKEEAEKFKQSIEEAKRQGEETLKQAGVPTKVVNKITKRRLK